VQYVGWFFSAKLQWKIAEYPVIQEGFLSGIEIRDIFDTDLNWIGRFSGP
jgi:hypothetical protein